MTQHTIGNLVQVGGAVDSAAGIREQAIRLIREARTSLYMAESLLQKTDERFSASNASGFIESGLRDSRLAHEALSTLRATDMQEADAIATKKRGGQ